MTLRDRLSLVKGNTVNRDHLIAIKKSLALAARLANDNRRRLAMLSDVVDDLILPAAPSQSGLPATLPPYPHHVVVQAKAMVGSRRGT